MKTSDMINKIREIQSQNHQYTANPLSINEAVLNEENDNLLRRFNVLMEETVEKNAKDTKKDSELKKYVIKKNNPQFGDIRTSQEDTLRKTIGENIKLSEDALVYYPDIDDMTIDGKIDSLSLSFQFRLNSTSGDGCFIWTDAMCLSESNLRTIGKIRDAFANWKDSLTQDGDLMDKLNKEAKKERN